MQVFYSSKCAPNIRGVLAKQIKTLKKRGKLCPVLDNLLKNNGELDLKEMR